MRFQLFYTPTSPFVRKVMASAHELGLLDQIETIRVRPVPTQNDSSLAKANPLAKIPTLVDGGQALYDSPVICEYLDSLASPPRLIPAAGPERWRVLRTQALADGVLDAAVLVFYETTQRPAERQFAPWLDMQREKAVLGLDELERSADQLGEEPDLGRIAVACTLGWLEFRKPIGEVRPGRPKLFAWYEAFRRRPSMATTEPHT